MQYNFFGIVVGSAGCGKTTLTRRLIADFVAQHKNGVVIAHDPNRQFLKDGAKWYDDRAAWSAAMTAAAKAGTPVPRVSSLGGKPAECTRLAFELGQRFHNSAENVRVPILLVFDEGSLHDERTYMSDENNELLATRRHRGVGLLFLCQRPGQLVAGFWEMSTDVYVFRLREKHCIKLAEAIDVDASALLGAAQLEPFTYLHAQQNKGVVNG